MKKNRVQEFLDSVFFPVQIPYKCWVLSTLVFTCHETQQFFSRYNIHHSVGTLGNPHSNSRSELAVKSLKRLLREYVSGSGCIDNDSVTQALLAHANTPCKVMMKSPAQIAYSRRLKDFLPRSAESLLPVPQDLLGAEEKEVKQLAIRQEAGRRLDLHAKVLPGLHEGDYLQLHNLAGHHPLKSDRTGVIVANNGFSNYSVKIISSSRITKRNRASLQTNDPRSAPDYQSGHDSLLSVQEAPELLGQVTRGSAGELGSGRRAACQGSDGTAGGGLEKTPVAQPTRLVGLEVPTEDINISLGSSTQATQSPLESTTPVVQSPGTSWGSEGDLSGKQVRSDGQGSLVDDCLLCRSTRQTSRPKKYTAE